MNRTGRVVGGMKAPEDQDEVGIPIDLPTVDGASYRRPAPSAREARRRRFHVDEGGRRRARGSGWVEALPGAATDPRNGRSAVLRRGNPLGGSASRRRGI